MRYKGKLIIALFIMTFGLVVVAGRVVLAHNTAPSYTQDGYWFLDDDASVANAEDETGYSGSNEGENTPITGVARSTTFMMRIDISETLNQDIGETIPYTLQYKEDNGGEACSDTSGWTDATTASGSPFQIVDSASIDGVYGTQVNRITTETSNFGASNGALLEVASYSVELDNKSGESQWALQATTNATYGQAYMFRITNNLSQTGLNSYTRCPGLTMGAAPAPTFTQNDFEWFVDGTDANLTNAWPAGTGSDLIENEILDAIPATNDPLESADIVRLQMNFTVTVSDFAAGTHGFELEYAQATDCSTATIWTNIGDIGSTVPWRIYDNVSIGDSTANIDQISTSNSGAEGWYSETNPTAPNPNLVDADSSQNSEYDWPLEDNGAAENTPYCFRFATDYGADFTVGGGGYTDYPQVYTHPGMSPLMRHGNFFSGDSEQGFFWAN